MTDTLTLPVLPLRDIVVFPHMIVPLFVGRDKSVAALEAAMAADKEIFLVAQLDPAEDDPGARRSVRHRRHRDRAAAAEAARRHRARAGRGQAARGSWRADDGGDYLTADDRLLVERGRGEGTEVEALMRSVVDQFENYAKLNKKLPSETAVQLSELDEAARLADAVAANIQVKVADKQALLVEADARKRLEMVFAFMEGELGVLQVEKKIKSRVKRQMEKTQREYYLNEQLKAIQRELGNEGEEGASGDEIAELTQKIATLKLSKEARTKATAELKKLKTMAPMSAEATVVRNYLDVLLGLPWGKKSKLKKDIVGGAGGARRGPLCAGEGQGPDRRISRGAGAHQQAEGPDPVPRRPSRRRQDRRSASRSPRRPAASSCASRWAACATRPRSAATAAPTSARCRARSSPT